MYDHAIFATSAEYAKVATKLSECIEEAEQFILTLPGRCEVYTPIDNETAIVFDKYEGKWRVLLYVKLGGDKDHEVPLVEASVEFKALAAPHLGQFYRDLLSELKQSLKKAEKGLAAAESFIHPCVASPSEA